MQLAVWNYPPADLMVSGFSSGPHKGQVDLLRRSPEECEQLLQERRLDAALVPTLAVLRNIKDYDVLPAVALSSWTYPFARLVMDHGLDEPLTRIAYDPLFEQEAFVTRLTLREHYRMKPEFVPHEGASIAEILDSDADGHLIVGPTVPTMSFDRLTLDVGQEWFELAQYPMCWGLFASPRGEASPEVIRTVRNGIRASESQRRVWLRAQETSQDLHTFYAEDLRFRLDDLVIASLTEFKQYLFYYDMIDEVVEIPFVYLSDEEEEEQGGSPLV